MALTSGERSRRFREKRKNDEAFKAKERERRRRRVETMTITELKARRERIKLALRKHRALKNQKNTILLCTCEPLYSEAGVEVKVFPDFGNIPGHPWEIKNEDQYFTVIEVPQTHSGSEKYFLNEEECICNIGIHRPLTSSERNRRYRQKRKNDEEYKRKERERRRRAKERMSISELKKKRENRRLYMRQYRRRKIEQVEEDSKMLNTVENCELYLENKAANSASDIQLLNQKSEVLSSIEELDLESKTLISIDDYELDQGSKMLDSEELDQGSTMVNSAEECQTYLQAPAKRGKIYRQRRENDRDFKRKECESWHKERKVIKKIGECKLRRAPLTQAERCKRYREKRKNDLEFKRNTRLKRQMRIKKMSPAELKAYRDKSNQRTRKHRILKMLEKVCGLENSSSSCHENLPEAKKGQFGQITILTPAQLSSKYLGKSDDNEEFKRQKCEKQRRTRQRMSVSEF